MTIAIPRTTDRKEVDQFRQAVVAQLDIPKVNYVDRGDPSAADFTQATLTTDGAWHDLNLSVIVPPGATAVNLAVAISDDSVGNALLVRKNGNSNSMNIGRISVQVSNVYSYASLFVSLDANRVIEYSGDNAVFTAISITVRGWWI